MLFSLFFLPLFLLHRSSLFFPPRIVNTSITITHFPLYHTVLLLFEKLLCWLHFPLIKPTVTWAALVKEKGCLQMKIYRGYCHQYCLQKNAYMVTCYKTCCTESPQKSLPSFPLLCYKLVLCAVQYLKYPPSEHRSWEILLRKASDTFWHNDGSKNY